jgi:hypothetical protein
MVRAILDGGKTQTRRVVKHEWTYGFEKREKFTHATWANGADFVTLSEPCSRRSGEPVWFYSWGNCRWLRCPYGVTGDRLWVRETFAAYTTPTYEYGESDLVTDRLDTGPYEGVDIVYKADGTSFPGKWRPSIFMPRWASRISLEITEVRLQRLHDIDERDARAEGYVPRLPDDPIGWYRGLWDTINGNGAWRENPWVWAITFRRLTP